MLPHRMIISAVLFGWLISTYVNSAAESLASSRPDEASVRSFAARGVVKELKGDGRTVVVSHEAITNYMDAMTMPFKAKEPQELMALRPGDQVMFRLSVTDTESWIDEISKIAAAAPPSPMPVPRKSGLEERAGERRPSKPTTIRCSITSSLTNWASG